VTDEKGAVVRSPKALQPRHNVTVRVAEGSAQIGIASVQDVL
jgi:exodeoxyribonuclease VII large subunit